MRTWIRGGVVVRIETDRGSWVQALIASGYQVYAINPRQVTRLNERYGSSGAKGDAHALADMGRIDRDQLRPVAGDSEQAQAVKVVAHAHQTLIWERTRTFRLRGLDLDQHRRDGTADQRPPAAGRS